MGGTARRVAPEHLEKLRDILALLDRSRRPDDMNVPGFRLHPLTGGRRGHWAVWISGNSRLTPWMWTMSTTIEMRERISRAMHNPPHPGGIVRRQCLEPLRLTVTDAAKGLGVTRQALSDLVNEKVGISVDMAIRLSKAFGSNPEAWLGMQTAYDLWQARDRMTTIEVQRFEPA
jgi:antitoxin HigA-1